MRPERAAAALLFLLTACGARSSLDAAGAAPSASGAAGEGGTFAGAGGVTGPGGAGGSSAQGGDAGAGAGGSEPALSVMQACVVAASCGTDPNDFFPATAGMCLDEFSRLGWFYSAPSQLPDPVLAERLLDCASKTFGDCAAFHSCFGGDWVTLRRCREGASCKGNVMVSSDGGPSYDCGAIDATCADLWSGAERACCNAEPCPQSTGVICDGTVASFCGAWGERVTFDCGVSGRTCKSDPLAPCLGAGACDPAMTVECSGDVAVYCSDGGLAEYDCSQTGFRTACNLGAMPWEPACRPKGSACGANDADSCNGTALQVCADGQWVGVDCTSLGFSACAEAQSIARCVK